MWSMCWTEGWWELTATRLRRIPEDTTDLWTRATHWTRYRRALLCVCSPVDRQCVFCLNVCVTLFDGCVSGVMDAADPSPLQHFVVAKRSITSIFDQLLDFVKDGSAFVDGETHTHRLRCAGGFSGVGQSAWAKVILSNPKWDINITWLVEFAVAQEAERLSCKQKVGGSIPESSGLPMSKP